MPIFRHVLSYRYVSLITHCWFACRSLGAVFTDARIGSVRIIAGNVAPGPFDENGEDIVMMDDFVYGEPQAAAISGPYRRRR